MTKNNKEFTIIHQKEASFFDEKSERVLALAQDEQESALLIDEDTVLKNYPDYYQYAYNLLGDIKGKKILDMGCDGKSSVLLAKQGAFVTAFDVSPRTVEVAKLRARINKVQDRVKVECMFAEDIRYASESFDFIFGIGILHHINIETSAVEISRVLKNNGQAIFLEPIAFSPLLRKIRNLSLVKAIVPNKGKNLLITENERQVYRKDIEFFRTIFKLVDYVPFQLFSRLDRLIGGYPVTRNKRIISLINRFDRVLLRRFRFLSRFGRWGVIRCVK